MKRIYLLFVLIHFFSLIYAKQIDENTARLAGQSFVANNTQIGTKASASVLQLVYTAKSSAVNTLNLTQPSTLYYVFNIDTGGFVIVSGDDNVSPVLGYSEHGNFDRDKLPQNVAKWLEGYKSEIRYILENKILATKEITESWQNLVSGNALHGSTKSTASVNPLMQTQWNQSPYYNASCPGGSVTGCVATAMAQIMKYWNYPSTGSGFHSYNHQNYGTLSANFGSTTYQWGSMPNSVNSSNTAVATLMYQVGVSVDMDYSPQSSGAYVITAQSPVTNCSEYALKTYFGYQSSLQGVQRSSYNQSQWVSLLKTELDAGRPVLYAGFGSGGGHCFVTDGYDNSDYFHFNWGWGGAYDGFFEINSLNPSGTGTGGGSGGYNSGHQAVIGIQPPPGNPNFDMKLYDYVTPSASTIYYGQAFSVSTNIVNSGTGSYSGDYCVAIFDASYNFVDYVQTLTGYTLQGGYAYINNLVFSTTGLFSMLPGNYYAAVYYRPTAGNWNVVANNGSYSNFVPISVINPNDIELNSAMIVTPGLTLTQGQSVSVNLNIINTGITTFYGQYAVALYNLDGSFAQTIGTVNETNGLPYNYTYLAPYLTFTNSSVTVAPGTYLLAVQHNPNNTGWQLTGSTNFQNPIKVTVVAASISPDIYEANNSLAQSYNLPITFTGNSATKSTTGSNIHITTDNDYYKIVLPAGYNYTITPRIHDSYNSGNGNTYTVDGLWSYSTNGSTWSDAYDDVMPGSITLNGGGTVYFHVAPYFAGETGTYLLAMNLTRTPAVGIPENDAADKVVVYPNPASDLINIDLDHYPGHVKEIKILNVGSEEVFSRTNSLENTILTIPLNNLSTGIYFLQLVTETGLITKKIVVSK